MDMDLYIKYSKTGVRHMASVNPVDVLDNLITAIGCRSADDAFNTIKRGGGGVGDLPVVCTKARGDLTKLLLKWKNILLQQHSGKVHPVESDTGFQDLDYDAVRKIVDYLKGEDVARLMCANSALYRAIKEKKQFENINDLKTEVLLNIVKHLIDWFKTDEVQWWADFYFGDECKLYLNKSDDIIRLKTWDDENEWCNVVELNKKQKFKPKHVKMLSAADHPFRMTLNEDKGGMLTVKIYDGSTRNDDFIKIDPFISSLIDFYNKTLLCIMENPKTAKEERCSNLQDVMNGGSSSGSGSRRRKIFILGRERVLHKRGRKWMLTYQRQQISLTEARALDKQRNSR
jgi:hypothetical protein